MAVMGRPSPARRGLSVLLPFDLSRVGCLWLVCVGVLQGGRRKRILVSKWLIFPLVSFSLLFPHLRTRFSSSPLLPCLSLTGRQKSMRGFHTDPGEVTRATLGH